MSEKLRVTIKVEKSPGEEFYSCYMVEDMPKFGLAGYGKSAREAIEDIYIAEKETRELWAEKGEEIPELEFRFKFDIGSFFNYYKYLSITGVAQKAGINASLMRQYAIGRHVPRGKRKQQIEECLHDIGNELQAAVIG